VAHPLSGNPLMYLLDRGRVEKCGHFLNNNSQIKTKQNIFQITLLRIKHYFNVYGKQVLGPK
jgi:hypothetical protein